MPRLTTLLCVLVLAASASAASADELVERSCQVVDLRDAEGKVRFALDGTPLLATASGEAELRIRRKRSEAQLRIRVKGLVATQEIGQEYLTYVAWRIDANGATRSLGELRNDGGEAKLVTETPRGSFGIIVSAEPHFAITRPSDTVVLSGRPTVKTAKRLASAEVSCRLLPRGHYAMERTQDSMRLLFASQARTPSEMLQARNAIDIARLSGAEEFAGDRLNEATQQLIQANGLLLGKGERKQAAAAATKAVTSAEMARQIAVDGKRDHLARVNALKQARREVDESARLLEEARRKNALDAEKRAELEKRLQEEKTLRIEAERRREQELKDRLETRQPERLAASPSAAGSELERFELVTERARIDQERQAARRENEALRQDLRDGHEQLIRESRREMESGLELERAKLQVALAEERAELKVERARLEAQRQLLEAQRTEPTPPAAAAPQPRKAGAEPTPKVLPADPVATDSKELARAQAEWEALSAQVSAERDALAAERKELRELSDELERRLETEPPPEESGATSPAKKRRWWFGGKKAPDQPAPAEDRATAAEIALESERLQMQAESQAERRRMNSELMIEREKLDAERARLEADMKLREAARYREPPTAARTPEPADPRVALLNQRVERLERDLAQTEGAKSDAVTDQQQTALMDEMERLGEQVQALGAAQAEKPATVTVAPPARIATRSEEERLAELLQANRSPRGLLVRLPDLSFPTGGHELRPEAREQLARVAGVLLGESDVRIEIEGHTDSLGDPTLNQRLSERRAAAVLNYLAQLGVPDSVMTAKGLGDSRPAAPNQTSAGRRQNRRVELIVTTSQPRTAATSDRQVDRRIGHVRDGAGDCGIETH